MKRYLFMMCCGLLVLAAVSPARAGSSPRDKANDVIDDLADDIKALRAPKPDKAKDVIDDLKAMEKALALLVKEGGKQLADVGRAAEKHTKKLGVDVRSERDKAVTAAKKLAAAVEDLREHMEKQSKLDAKKRESGLEDAWNKDIAELAKLMASLVKAAATLDKAVLEARKDAAKLHGRGADPTNAIQKELAAEHKKAATLDDDQLKALARWERANEEYKHLVETDASRRELQAKDAVLDRLDDELEDLAEDLETVDKKRAALRKKLLKALAAIDAVALGAVAWDKE